LSIFDVSPCVISIDVMSNNTLEYGSILFAEYVIETGRNLQVMIGTNGAEAVNIKKKTSTFS
jgi:hypothetical protein